MIELKPCTKCGNKVKVESDYNNKTRSFTHVTVRCLGCNAIHLNIKPEKRQKLRDLRKQAAKWWNENSQKFNSQEESNG